MAPLAVDDAKALHLLLVARDPRWTAAVHAAAADIDGSAVLACGARDALVQLAGREHFSHLLVEAACADGLLDELVGLTFEQTATPTPMFLLGATANSPPRLAVIRTADRRSVRRALAPRLTPPGSGETSMHPTELRNALTGTMIEARYQPIVRMADRAPIAVEALARLNHPDRGTLLPDQFVPQLEDAGLARELTELISQRVFADLTAPVLGGLALKVALNFPLDVLLQPEAMARLEAQRQAAGIPTRQVVAELTESRPVEDLVTLRRSLDQLRSLGYGAAIDDVSPALPNLAGLLDMPFTCLKLDKYMVQDSEHNADMLEFVRRTTAAAQARGMTVVAEGVETAPLWHLMLSLGVDQAQGFLVARALPLAAVPVWLAAWQSVTRFP